MLASIPWHHSWNFGNFGTRLLGPTSFDILPTASPHCFSFSNALAVIRPSWRPKTSQSDPTKTASRFRETAEKVVGASGNNRPGTIAPWWYLSWCMAVSFCRTNTLSTKPRTFWRVCSPTTFDTSIDSTSPWSSPGQLSSVFCSCRRMMDSQMFPVPVVPVIFHDGAHDF